MTTSPILISCQSRLTEPRPRCQSSILTTATTSRIGLIFGTLRSPIWRLRRYSRNDDGPATSIPRTLRRVVLERITAAAAPMGAERIGLSRGTHEYARSSPVDTPAHAA